MKYQFLHRGSIEKQNIICPESCEDPCVFAGCEFYEPSWKQFKKGYFIVSVVEGKIVPAHIISLGDK